MSKVVGERFAVVPDSILYADVSPTAKLFWAILARHADPVGACYPGLKSMAKAMGVSEDTVRRAKRELVEAGLLTAEPRHDEQGRRTTDLLFLHTRGSKFATYGGSKFATPYIDAVELKPEELNPPTPHSDRKRRQPTDTTPIPSGPPIWPPEPTATVEDRRRAAAEIRRILDERRRHAAPSTVLDGMLNRSEDS